MSRRYRNPQLAVAALLLALAAAGQAAAQESRRAGEQAQRSTTDTRSERQVQPGRRWGTSQESAAPAAPAVAPPVPVNVQRREERRDNRQDQRGERRDDRPARVQDRREDRGARRDDGRDYRTERRDDRRFDDRRFDDRRDPRFRGGAVLRPPLVVNRPLRPPVRVIRTLPPGHRSFAWRGSPYYQHGGFWYRPFGSQFMVTAAPFGLFTRMLPPYHSAMWVGGSQFFFADNTFYSFDAQRRGYVVSRSPYGDDWDDGDFDDRGGGGDAGGPRDEDLFIYPARGQSEQQQADDRFECHRWSAEQTQYDPTRPDFQRGVRADYDRAITACLTGRGYSVK